MNPRFNRRGLHCALLLLAVTVCAPDITSAQPEDKPRGCEQRLAKPSKARAGGAEAELYREVADGTGFLMRFRPTALDDQAQAYAQVAIKGQALLVRVCASSLPPPSKWGERRYSLWVFLPSPLRQYLYIGDLPVRPGGKLTGSGWKEAAPRGDSDTAFRFPAMPRGAVFGGLVVTAEQPRYDPIINEPLRPLLTAMVASGDIIDVAVPAPSVAPVADPVRR